MADLGLMIYLASKHHLGQFDKQGKPYILHCLEVMRLLEPYGEEVQCMGVGHDLLEDTDLVEEDLVKYGFSERIIAGIKSVTKVDGESYDLYKAKVKANADGIRVKIADLTHNSQITRLKGITDKDFARMKKYHQFYLELKELV